MFELFLSSRDSAPLPSVRDESCGLWWAVFDDECQTLWCPQASAELLQLPMATAACQADFSFKGVSHAVELHSLSTAPSFLSSWTVLESAIKQEPSESFHSTGQSQA